MLEKRTSVFWTVVAFATFIIVIYLLVKHKWLIEHILYRSGPLAPLVAILLYPLLAPTPITTDPVTVVIGVIYTPLIGVMISWVGNTLASAVEYYLGTKIDSATNFRESKHKMPFGLGKLPAESVPFLIFGRMIPGYGAKIISVLAGMYHVPMKRYVWTTAVTNLLGSVLLSYGGFLIVHLIRILKLI